MVEEGSRTPSSYRKWNCAIPFEAKNEEKKRCGARRDARMLTEYLTSGTWLNYLAAPGGIAPDWFLASLAVGPGSGDFFAVLSSNATSRTQSSS
jgi:hypothetical protein